MHGAPRSAACLSRFLQLGGHVFSAHTELPRSDGGQGPLCGLIGVHVAGGDVTSFGSELLLLRHTSCVDVLSTCEQTSILVLCCQDGGGPSFSLSCLSQEHSLEELEEF